MLKTGTKIITKSANPEFAKIGRWLKVSGPRIEGYHVVVFSDGGKILMHEGDFRLIDAA